MVRVSSPAKLRPWSELTAKMVHFAFRGIPCFFRCFSFFSKDLRGSEETDNPCIFGDFPCISQKSKEKKIRVVHLKGRPVLVTWPSVPLTGPSVPGFQLHIRPRGRGALKSVGLDRTQSIGLLSSPYPSIIILPISWAKISYNGLTSPKIGKMLAKIGKTWLKGEVFFSEFSCWEYARTVLLRRSLKHYFRRHHHAPATHKNQDRTKHINIKNTPKIPSQDPTLIFSFLWGLFSWKIKEKRPPT